MSSTPVPEPTEGDEKLALALTRIKDATHLRGTSEGGRRCDTCHFYAAPDQPIAYCWHDELEIMVAGSWCCDRWEQVGRPDEQPSQEDRTTARRLHVDKVEAQHWLDHPNLDQQCNTCLYYLNPEESVSYCWHPGLQTGVGFDHWCRGWQEIPGHV